MMSYDKKYDQVTLLISNHIYHRLRHRSLKLKCFFYCKTFIYFHRVLKSQYKGLLLGCYYHDCELDMWKDLN